VVSSMCSCIHPSSRPDLRRQRPRNFQPDQLSPGAATSARFGFAGATLRANFGADNYAQKCPVVSWSEP
jgi:hypothetical protein